MISSSLSMLLTRNKRWRCQQQDWTIQGFFHQYLPGNLKQPICVGSAVCPKHRVPIPMLIPDNSLNWVWYCFPSNSVVEFPANLRYIWHTCLFLQKYYRPLSEIIHLLKTLHLSGPFQYVAKQPVNQNCLQQPHQSSCNKWVSSKYCRQLISAILLVSSASIIGLGHINICNCNINSFTTAQCQ
jgi:hypothetical protein